MGKLVTAVVLLFAGLVAYVYVFGAPETAGHGVDPAKAVDSAGKVADAAGDYGKPWYDYLSAQAWFGTALFAIAIMWALKRIWAGMNTTAKIGVSVLGAVILVLTAIGLNT